MLQNVCSVCYIIKTGVTDETRLLQLLNPILIARSLQFFCFICYTRVVCSVCSNFDNTSNVKTIYTFRRYRKKKREGKAQSLSLPALYSVLQLGPS